MNNQLALSQPAELVRQSTDIAELCREMAKRCAVEIQGKRYIPVEVWQSIATAHHCLASSRDVERVEGGYKAIGEIRRMTDGALLAQAEGFVGEDEPVWFGGDSVDKWGKKKAHVKRPDYAIRAMCQTRAISRACRSAFAHVVVLMDAGLSTTPAEEVPQGGFDEVPQEPKDEGRVTNDAVPGWFWQAQNRQEGIDGLSKAYDGQKVGVKKTKDGWRVVVFGAKPVDGPEEITDAEDAEISNAVGHAVQGDDFRSVRVHFGKNQGLMLSELSPFQRKWYAEDWMPKREKEAYSNDDKALMDALKAWQAAAGTPVEPRQATKPAPEVSTQQTGSWKAVKVHVPFLSFKGHPLCDLDEAGRNALRAKMEEKAKLGTRNLSAPDKKLIAALAMELGERGGKQPEMSDKAEAFALAGELADAGLSQDDFIAAAKFQQWITDECVTFGQLLETECTRFLDDFDNVELAVRDFIAKREGAK